MKFLLELMSCCGSNSRTYASSGKEETKSLVSCVVPQRTGRSRGLKRGRTAARSGRNGSSIKEWRPSLSSIAEDKVLQERNEREEAAAGGSPSERNLKRKVLSSPKARSRSHLEDAGRASVEAMMPAFSAAPFMF